MNDDEPVDTQQLLDEITRLESDNSTYKRIISCVQTECHFYGGSTLSGSEFRDKIAKIVGAPYIIKSSDSNQYNVSFIAEIPSCFKPAMFQGAKIDDSLNVTYYVDMTKYKTTATIHLENGSE